MKFSALLNLPIDKNMLILIGLAAAASVILILIFGLSGAADSGDVDKRYFNKKIKFLAKSINMSPLAEYKVSDAVRQEIITSYCDQSAVKKLVKEIFTHFGIPFENTEINIEFDNTYSRFYEGDPGPAGSYIRYADGSAAIRVVLKPSYGIDEIVAIVCHECSHAFLFNKGVRIEPREQNEMLTDITAVYLGCGKYLLKGYAPVNRIATRQTANSKITSIRSASIGYIKMPQCRYVYKKVGRMRRRYGAGRKIK